MARLLTAGVGALLLSVLVTASCHPSGEARCAYEQWRGNCQLQAVDRVRLIETMPEMSVLQAVYDPQPSGQGQTLLPPSSRQEFRIRAEHEAAFKDHLRNNPIVTCSYQARTAGACSEGSWNISLPPFQAPPPVEVQKEDAGADDTGSCADLDRGKAAAQGTDAELPAGVPVELFFKADSSKETPEIEQQVAKVAELLLQRPEIACVAVVGHVTAGEQMILGDERASLVKNLLVSRGIKANRLQTIAAVVPMTGGAPRAVIEADRKVRLRVLLRNKP